MAKATVTINDGLEEVLGQAKDWLTCPKVRGYSPAWKHFFELRDTAEGLDRVPHLVPLDNRKRAWRMVWESYDRAKVEGVD